MGRSTGVTWHHAADASAGIRAVTETVESITVHAVRERGRAVIALPGGKTPQPIFDALATRTIPWSAVTIIPGDDRVVPIESPLSNVAALQRRFAPVGARVEPLCAGHMDHRHAGVSADRLLHALPWPLDLVWLGVGGDGHTASLFAGPDLAAGMTLDDEPRAIGVRPDPLPPEAPVHRVTLTASAIAAARQVIVVISGADKRRLVETAIAEGASSTYPIGAVLSRLRAATVFAWDA